MAGRLRWRPGWNDLSALVSVAVPLAAWAILNGGHTLPELGVVGAALGIAVALRHLLRAGWEELAVVPPVAAALVELTSQPYTLTSLLLAPAVGVGLLLWMGADPQNPTPLLLRFEPALVPALAAGVALAVMLFLPGGSGGQVGLAALALGIVLGLSAWLYLRSAVEATGAASAS